MRRAMLVVALTTILALPASADRLYFKHGDYVDVDGWREEGDLIIYKRFGGEIGVPKADVARIERMTTDPTEWQAPGSSRTPSRPSSVVEPVPAPTQGSAATAIGSPPPTELWTPPPLPTLPSPPKVDAGKAILANYWDGQKQFALSRMDYYGNELKTCASRYRTRSVIQACQESADDLRRFWNERYIVASREYEKVR
jgi:hypothetical protein